MHNFKRLLFDIIIPVRIVNETEEAITLVCCSAYLANHERGKRRILSPDKEEIGFGKYVLKCFILISQNITKIK